MRGSEKLLEEFKRVLGIEVSETTPDGKFSLDCLRCVGACGLAPVVMIGEKVYQTVARQNTVSVINDGKSRIEIRVVAQHCLDKFGFEAVIQE